jgi:hypothetical protein
MGQHAKLIARLAEDADPAAVGRTERRRDGETPGSRSGCKVKGSRAEGVKVSRGLREGIGSNHEGGEGIPGEGERGDEIPQRWRACADGAGTCPLREKSDQPGMDAESQKGALD